MAKKKEVKKQQAANKNAGKKKQEDASAKQWWAFLIIAAITFIAYYPALHNGFVNLDDDRYITENPKLNTETIGNMFSIPGGFHMGNYHPFVMVGYKIIHTLSDPKTYLYNPLAYHFINLLIHILNSILAFLIIRKLTGKFEIGFVAGLLFGISTMHVESVAWISELKDVLHTFFYFFSLLYYLRYLDDTSKRKFYFIAILLFLFALLSKGQATSLSAVLVLIDFYKRRKFNTQLWLEKAPFFALSLMFGIIAIYAQKSMGAVQDIALFPFYERIIFACYGYLTYIWKLIIPLNLSAYYGYPTKVNNVLNPVYYLYPVIFVALMAGTIYSLKQTRKIFFGIGFFSVTIVMVLQLLPVGGCIISDRYCYIPSLGIFYLLAEGVYYLYERTNYRALAYLIMVVATLGYSAASFSRCHIWKDGMTMWSDVIDKSKVIALAFNNRGVLYNKEGQALNDSINKTKNNALAPEKAMAFKNAIADFRNALVLNSKDDEALNNMGLAYWRLGILDSGEYYLRRALASNPRYAAGWSNLGSVLFSMKRVDESLKAYQTSVQCDPSFSDGWYNIGILNYNLGRKDTACAALKRAAALGMQHSADAVRDLCK